ncbi:hypothetical protein KAR91_01535 [Candidatus Pacearchaeota archaeon]|nr:hypothetical protein [Candidatus Pacearchaeota archaeon]
MKEYDIKEIGPIIEKAWGGTFELVCEHPKIVSFQETQLHIEFAHLLLTYLKENDYEPWKDLVIGFDTPHFGFEGTGGIPWRLLDNNRIRPDIYIMPSRSNDVNKPKVWIELKSQSNIIRQKNGKLVPKKSKVVYDTIKSEEKKYKILADSFGGNFFIYAVMYYHHAWEEGKGFEVEMCEELKGYNWIEHRTLGNGSVVSHFFELIETSSINEYFDNN